MMNLTTKNVAPVLLVVVALYVTWCAGVQHGTVTQKARGADAVVKAVRDTNQRWKLGYMKRELARDSQLAATDRHLRGARGEITRLRQVIKPIEAVDSIPELWTQLALRDTVIGKQASVIAGLDSTVTLYQAMVRDRDEMIDRREREIAVLTTARDNWRRAASPGLLAQVVRAVPYVLAGAVLWEAVR